MKSTNMKYEILLSNIKGLKSTPASAQAMYFVGKIDFGLLGGSFAITSTGQKKTDYVLTVN